MEDSGYDSNSAVIPDRASGYVWGPGGMANAGFINMATPFSAGGLYSTSEDLWGWEQGLFGGKLLSSTSLKEMTTPFRNNYAFGLSVNTINGHKAIGHGGEIEGFSTLMLYYPDDKLTLVVLANVNGSAPQTICKDLGILALARAGSWCCPRSGKWPHRSEDIRRLAAIN
jgi:CubicO group peptidase (beta-lactamase class C family)